MDSAIRITNSGLMANVNINPELKKKLLIPFGKKMPLWEYQNREKHSISLVFTFIHSFLRHEREAKKINFKVFFFLKTIWDRDILGKNDFLGNIGFTVEEIREISTLNEPKWFSLQEVKSGSVELKIRIISEDLATLDVGFIFSFSIKTFLFLYNNPSNFREKPPPKKKLTRDF